MLEKENANEPLLMGSAPNKSSDNTDKVTTSQTEYKVYRERWLVLAVCCFLALSNAMQWISFTSMSNEVQIFYRGQRGENSTDASSFDVSLVSNQIFQLVAVLTGFSGMYITDTKGIKTAGMLGTSLNLLGATIRMIASIPLIQSLFVREILHHTGSFIAASAQAFFLVLPSKIAECWFPGDQRAIANVLSFVANPAGVALGTITPSLIFRFYTDITQESWIFFGFTLGMECLALFPFILALLVRHKLPPTPPSASSAAHQSNIGFIQSILQCITNFQFFIQMTLFAFAFSLLWSAMIYLDLPLTTQGYQLSGYPTAVCAIVGTLTSFIAGRIADKTRKFKEIVRFCSIGFAVSMISLRCYLQNPSTGMFDTVVIYILCGCLGAFSIPQFPIGVEMGVETTFPVLEATSSGILVIFGSLFMFIIPFIQTLSAQHLTIFYSQKDNWKFALDVTCGFAVFAVILSVFVLKPKYLRLELENSKREEEEEAPTKLSRESSATVEETRGSSFEMH